MGHGQETSQDEVSFLGVEGATRPAGQLVGWMGGRWEPGLGQLITALLKQSGGQVRPRGRRGAEATWSVAWGETPVLSLRTENWFLATNEPDVTEDSREAGESRSRRVTRPHSYGARSACALGSHVTARSGARVRVCVSLHACGRTGVSLTPVSTRDTKERKPQAAPRGLQSRGADGCQPAGSRLPPTPHPRARGSDREPGAVGLGGAVRGGFGGHQRT